jgi:hypothetical protein
VKEHPAPALYLPFQLDFQSVFLAEQETIDFVLGGLRAWCSTHQVVALASGPPGPLFLAVLQSFLLSHEKRLLSLPAAPGIPRFAGPSPKEEGDSKKRPHTYMTLTDIKRPQAMIAVVSMHSMYLVYQDSSGRSVSRGTLCFMTPSTSLEYP